MHLFAWPYNLAAALACSRPKPKSPGTWAQS